MPIRLLHTRTLEFQCFPNKNEQRIPNYAILSHTWGADDETVTYRTFSAMAKRAPMNSRLHNPAMQKIFNFCNQAARDGFEYGWVDTCCIDKHSVNAITEAINSMFRYYQESTLCYVYLADVASHDRLTVQDSAFRRSRWFTRGWTLQELIAPRSLVFYSGDWKYLSDKTTLRHTISDITGIDEHVLATGDVSSVPMTMRLSWASNRTTTRREDRAYCLVGFFGIFMPAIYGEGDEAFQRLQREIIKTDNDQTIFSWVGDGRPSGMLANKPSQFIVSKQASYAVTNIRNPEFSITNRGLRIKLPMIQLPLYNLYAQVLNAVPEHGHSQPPNGFLVHFIYRVHDDHNEFVRVFNDEVACFPASLRTAQNPLLTMSEAYVGQPSAHFAMNRRVTFCLKNYPSVSARPGPSVLGPPNMVGHFSAIPQRPSQPHIITMELDDQMPSTIMLFKNDAGQQIAVCLTVWGDKIKVGLSADCATADLSQIADAFLFGKIPMTFKQLGNFATQATPRRGNKVTLSLSEPTRHATMGTVCDINLAADKGFWLDAIGPGVLPGCWTRYFDSLAQAKPVKQRTGFFGRKTVEGQA